MHDPDDAAYWDSVDDAASDERAETTGVFVDRHLTSDPVGTCPACQTNAVVIIDQGICGNCIFLNVAQATLD